MRNLKQILPGYPNPDKADIISASSYVRHCKYRTAGNSLLIRSLKLILLVLPLAGYSQNFIVNTGIGLVNSGTMTTNGVWTNAAGSTISNSGTIKTTAIFTSATGSSIANTGSITTSESWTNNGTLTGIGKFILNYATDKSFKSGGTDIGLLRKSGAGTALVTGSLSTSTSDSLNIKGGIIKLVNAGDVLWAKGKVGVNAGSYIDGAFAQTGGGDKVFPLGRDGLYLPITLVGLTSSKTTARIEAAPSGLAPGTAVKSLVDFPYVWHVDEGAVADTATAVEVSYPSTLPIPENPIIGRQVDGTRYTSMGAKTFTNMGGRVTVQSFSPRLKGIYTIVNGYLSNPEADRQALIDLYNNTNGAGWANKTNWLTQTSIDQWFGVSVTANTITEVNLPNNNLAGTVPQSLTGILSLKKFNAAGNAITAIPDFSGSEAFNYLDVSNNKLEFGSLEQNRALLTPPRTFNYLVQADIGEEKTEYIDVNTAYNIAAPTSGSNTYVWKRNGTTIGNSNSNPYQIASIGRANMGTFTAEITNDYFPGLTLKTKPVTALAVADVQGKLFYLPAKAATNGTMTLYKVGVGEYEITQEKAINADGTFTLNQVVVGDYLLKGFVDPVKYENALPTYLGNTIYWDESDVIPINSDLSSLNIISEYVPGELPVTAPGVIRGYMADDGIEGGRIQKPGRLAGAGTSVRKVQGSGRGQEVSTLVAYVLTDEDGEFAFENLEPGDYRINIQYPGYPMDTTSFIKMTIGTGIKSEVVVAGEVKNGKISISPLRITNIYEKEDYVAEAFPNPASTTLNVKFAIQSQQRLITLTDVMGRELFQENANGLSWQTNVANLAAGVYILKVTDKNEVVKTMRLVKE
jgi:hypothetical protein